VILYEIEADYIAVKEIEIERVEEMNNED